MSIICMMRTSWPNTWVKVIIDNSLLPTTEHIVCIFSSHTAAASSHLLHAIIMPGTMVTQHSQPSCTRGPLWTAPFFPLALLKCLRTPLPSSHLVEGCFPLCSLPWPRKSSSVTVFRKQEGVWRFLPFIQIILFLKWSKTPSHALLSPSLCHWLLTSGVAFLPQRPLLLFSCTQNLISSSRALHLPELFVLYMNEESLSHHFSWLPK